MIAEAYAKAQVKRLAGLDFFPAEPAAVRELVSALAPAKSESLARICIDSFLAEMTQCPKPAEIRRVLFDISVEKEWQPADEKERSRCERCNGSGWVHEVRVIRAPHYGPHGSKNLYAMRCPCRK